MARFCSILVLVAACRTPEPLAALPTAITAPPMHTIKVHLYAAQAYRSAHSDWEYAARQLLLRAQEAGGRATGVSFSVQRVSTFDPDASATLEQALSALEQHDPGGEGDLVVGLIGALPIFSTAVHDLARARSPGRHVVLRSNKNADAEVTVLLHAWAHTLGAVHAREPDRIMAAEVHDAPAGFAQRDKDLIGVGLAHFPAMLQDGTELAAYKHEAALYLRAHAADFDPEALTATLDWLGIGQTQLAPLPEREAAWFREAKDHADNNRIDLAWQALSWLDAFALNPEVATLTCRVALLHAAKSEDTRARCRRAAERSPSDPTAILLRAQAELVGGDAVAAAESLVRAADLIDRTQVMEKVWDFFGTLAQNAGCITFAQKAAASVGGDKLARVQAWAELARRRAAIPAGMQGADECRLQAELTPVIDHADHKRWADAAAAAERSVARHPDTAAPLSLLCEAIAQAGRDGDAEPICARAIAAAPEASVPLYWLGVIAWRKGDGAAAAARFSQVIALDPEAGHAKEMLRRATTSKPPAPSAKPPSPTPTAPPAPQASPERSRACDTLFDAAAAFTEKHHACGLSGMRANRESCRAKIAHCEDTELAVLDAFAACIIAVPRCEASDPQKTMDAFRACGMLMQEKLGRRCLEAFQAR
jgi:tetratricopeptide (TPR) repeat protein